MAKGKPTPQLRLTDNELGKFVWQATGMIGRSPVGRDAIAEEHAELDTRCPVPGGWGLLGFVQELLPVRNTVWRDADTPALWEYLDRTLAGAMLICDEALRSYMGLHIVCRQTEDEFTNWITWNREATMVVNPVRYGDSLVWCSRLVDMTIHQQEDEAV